jgi:hypothetical protein
VVRSSHNVSASTSSNQQQMFRPLSSSRAIRLRGILARKTRPWGRLFHRALATCIFYMSHLSRSSKFNRLRATGCRRHLLSPCPLALTPWSPTPAPRTSWRTGCEGLGATPGGSVRAAEADRARRGGGRQRRALHTAARRCSENRAHGRRLDSDVPACRRPRASSSQSSRELRARR